MPWNNNGGGGGPWKPNPKSPWGQGPTGAGPGPSAPDLEEFLRRGQDRLRQVLPGGGAGFGGKGLALLAVVGVGLWVATGLFTVQPSEMALKTLFGRYNAKVGSGLHYNWPYPVGGVIKLPVEVRNSISVGFAARVDGRTGSQATIDVPEESLMLTGDENIADVKFVVIWQIDRSKPEDFAFNVRRPESTIKAVAESAIREVVGRTQFQRIVTERKLIEPAVQELTQRVLNDYNAGVEIVQVQLQSVDPPEQVIAAFRDVTAAQQDQDRMRNEAEAYANKVVPEARGASARITQEAEAYRQQTVAEANGQASRFDQVYTEYNKAPAVTRQRLYLETMERVLGGMNKVIIDQSAGGPGVVPYLPLGVLNDTGAAAPRTPTQGAVR